ncbi:hypothetical protein SAMN05880574_12632 [Chryseobacterium sp. RU37D]|uniref:hypothetical protein n=1 Tax=Chryseobacterium sp. RU37D TaxID=1907397 RepID=UPI0009560B39|nr:hypothetical protein [Chryseobacterium sp. RU37D]SIQ80852.1 hypothetical protein SAMN05880574_12632 [Chryseobacterium sp. RU37D]
MKYFKEIKDILIKDYAVDNAELLELDELKNAVIGINDETLLRKFEMNEYLFNYQLNINYEELYQKRVNNYFLIQEKNKNNPNLLLEAKYRINDVGVLLHIDGEGKKIFYEENGHSNIDTGQLVSSYISFSFNKDWGYMNFILTNDDLILIDIIRGGQNEFYGYELKESLKEIFQEDSDDNISKFTINLLKHFTLKINALDIL